MNFGTYVFIFVYPTYLIESMNKHFLEMFTTSNNNYYCPIISQAFIKEKQRRNISYSTFTSHSKNIVINFKNTVESP